MTLRSRKNNFRTYLFPTLTHVWHDRIFNRHVILSSRCWVVDLTLRPLHSKPHDVNVNFIKEPCDLLVMKHSYFSKKEIFKFDTSEHLLTEREREISGESACRRRKAERDIGRCGWHHWNKQVVCCVEFESKCGSMHPWIEKSVLFFSLTSRHVCATNQRLQLHACQYNGLHSSTTSMGESN